MTHHKTFKYQRILKKSHLPLKTSPKKQVWSFNFSSLRFQADQDGHVAPKKKVAERSGSGDSRWKSWRWVTTAAVVWLGVGKGKGLVLLAALLQGLFGG